jgi:hypothetical protein
VSKSVLNEAGKRRVKRAAHKRAHFARQGITKGRMNERKLGWRIREEQCRVDGEVG